MTEKLETKDYIFYIDGAKLMVQYQNEDRTISLSNLDIEILGISTIQDKPVITVITEASIQKLKHQVSETLEVVGYVFESLDEALRAFNFITFWLDRLRASKLAKETDATSS